MGLKPRIETAFERGLFMSRWLMAPFYLGLVLALAMLLVVFIRELAVYVPQALSLSQPMGANTAILALLTLVDLSLAGNLLLIVVFSGYENFVSKLDLDGETDRPPRMGKVDFSGLKMKLLASIVAISGIQLLKTFMNIGKPGHEFDPTEAMWGVIIHLTFVLSGVLLALMDWLTARTDRT